MANTVRLSSKWTLDMRWDLDVLLLVGSGKQRVRPEDAMGARMSEGGANEFQ